MPVVSLRAPFGALLDLVLPGLCAVCGQPQAPLCPACAAELELELFGRPRRVAPDPAPRGLPAVTATAPWAGVLRRAVTAYKDQERRDLRAVLAPLLLTSLLADAPTGPVTLVPVPSSRSATRRRGDAPVAELVRAAVRLEGSGRLVLAPALRPVRRLADQAGLGHRERAVNLAGAYAVPRRWVATVVAAPVLLVDDVVTTGATLAEAARAVRAVGGHVLAAATLAATQRRAGAGATFPGSGTWPR